MKKIILFISLFLFVQKLSAQYEVKKRFQVTGGIGITNYGAPMSLQMDYGLFRDISLGLEINNRFSNETFQKYRILGGDAKLNYHFNNLFQLKDERWDIYAGGHYTYWLVTENIKDIKTDSANMGYGMQLGFHFYQWQHVGFNVEMSGTMLDGKHYLTNESKFCGSAKIGLTFRF